MPKIPSAGALDQFATGDATTADEYLSLVAENRSKDVDAEFDFFWQQGSIDLFRWDRLYPYQLLVVQENEGGFRAFGDWKFTLPVPPEALTYSMPFAIETNVTLGGIIEEHNGVPIRNISIRGTTGHIQGRGAPEPNKGIDLGSAIFGGTLAATTRAIGSAIESASSATGQAPKTTNIYDVLAFGGSEDNIGAGPESVLATSTGYYQFRRLKKFFEAYVNLKKDHRGRHLHLALALWKDQAVYLVTPTVFDVSRASNTPLEYQYSMSFKAWRRIWLGGQKPGYLTQKALRRDPNKLARVLNTLRDGRRAMQQFAKIPGAFIGDINRLLFEPMREYTLFVKDTLGVGLSVADMPDEIKRQMQPSIVDLQGSLVSVHDTANHVNDTVKKNLNALANVAGEVWDSVTTGTIKHKRDALDSSPAVHIFEHPQKHYDTFEGISIGKLQVPVSVSRLVSKERNRVSNFTRRDFQNMRNKVQEAASKLATAVGAGHETYSKTFDISAPRIKKEPTESDWEALHALDAVIQTFDAAAATADGERVSREDAVQTMAQLARRSGIAFEVPQSKFAVPFPYGSTLQDLARTYLGDPDRWHEIAALNGLREPYIDEVGFELELIVPGNESEVVIEKTDQLYVGQIVFIGSNTARRSRRRILGISNKGTNTTVTVDGDPDMDQYRPIDNAVLTAFLPDTVNSQSLIYIPSDDDPGDDNFITRSIPGVNEFDPMVVVGGVDWLLDNNNNLIWTPDGDNRFSSGLANIIQNTRIALSVVQGTLMGHNSFGLPLRVGASTAEFTASDIVDAVRRMLSRDPSFARIDGVQVQKDGPVTEVGVSVVVTGTEQPVPIGFQIQR